MPFALISHMSHLWLQLQLGWHSHSVPSSHPLKCFSVLLCFKAQSQQRLSLEVQGLHTQEDNPSPVQDGNPSFPPS